jgi:HlyD family secretion protein
MDSSSNKGDTMVSAMGSESSGKVTPIRDTAGQDRVLDQGPRFRKLRNRYALGGAIALVVVVLLGWLIHRWLAAEVSIPLERVRIAEVTRGLFVRDVSAPGTVVAAVSPTLFSPALGTVHFLVNAGDSVAKGQPLCTVDSPELRNEQQREQATLDGLEVAVQRQAIDTRRDLLENQHTIDIADVNLQAAKREERRAEESWRQRIISQRDYEKARDDAAAADVNHAHAVAEAGLKKESLEFELRAKRLERDRQRLLVQDLTRRVTSLDMRSPVTGVVGSLLVSERATAAQNAPLISVVDLTAFEIEFQVPESYGNDLGIGMQAEVTYGASQYATKVSAVSPEVKLGQVTGRLRFVGDVPQGLRQNQRVSTRIVFESRDGVLQVQRGPFLDTGGGRVTYVVRDDIATKTPIVTGATSISAVEITQGLSAGDRVIISSLSDFDRNNTVRLSQ